MTKYSYQHYLNAGAVEKDRLERERIGRIVQWEDRLIGALTSEVLDDGWTITITDDRTGRGRLTATFVPDEPSFPFEWGYERARIVIREPISGTRVSFSVADSAGDVRAQLGKMLLDRATALDEGKSDAQEAE